mmetsp:Transcript_17501/g.25914  ORF Transcript_17501/g.25914 Transcript_17501/m.25914 type:complete len:188 (-) Transcript_17501:162-725(-)
MSLAYSVTASTFHWAAAVPMVMSIGAVLKAQQSPKEEKGMWMYRHKSMGLLSAFIVAPRLAYRLMTPRAYNVEKIAGTTGVEEFLAKATHYGLYAFMVIMPASGIAMGYYGGKGLPFFFTTLPGITKTEDNKAFTGQIAKNSFNIHKQVGTYGKYLVPVHAGAAFMHYFRGHTIFSRVNPFRTPPPM